MTAAAATTPDAVPEPVPAGALRVLAVVRDGHPLPSGPPGAALVAHDGLAAVVTPAPERLRPRRRDLLAHHDLLLALAAEGPVLPLRFGTVAPDRAAVLDRLRDGRQTYAAALERVAGHCEFNLKALPSEAALPHAARHDDRVRHLREQVRRRGDFETSVRLGEAVARALAALAVRAGEETAAALEPLASARHTAPAAGDRTDGPLVNVSFLVPAERAAEFAARAAELADHARETADLRISGPLPCYSFTDVPQPAGA